MRSRTFKLIALAGLLVAVAALVRGPRSTRLEAAPKPALTLGRTRDGFLLVDGPLLREVMARTPSRAVLVNVWASWCGPCKEDLPMLVALPKKYDRASLTVLLVSVDGDDGLPIAAEMLSGLGAPRPSFVVKGSLETFKKEMNPRWPGMIPATFLFDRAGKLHFFWGGPVYDTDVEPVLKRFLAGENVDGEANFALSPGATDVPGSEGTKEP